MAPGSARDDLIRALIPRVSRITARFIRLGGQRASLADDIYSAGLEGLVRGVDRFDPARGVPVGAYVERRITGAIQDLLREEDHLSRDERRRARETGIETRPYPLRLDDDSAADLHDVLPNARADDPEDVAARRRAVVVFERAARALPARTREILRLYYSESLSQKEIGARLGVTETRICQLMREAHKAIREALGQPAAGRSPQAPYSRRPLTVAPPIPAIHRVRRPARPGAVSEETREALRRSAEERRDRRAAKWRAWAEGRR